MALTFLLSLDYAGRTWRFATQACAPLDGSTPVFHIGGLTIEQFEESANILQVTPELRTVALSLLWPSPGVASLVSRGHRLDRARGELSLWDGESDYEDREILMAGALIEPVYGAADEPVEASLEELPYTDTTQIPEVANVISSETWPSSDETIRGNAYPEIFGLPGHITGRTSIERDIPCTPGYNVHTTNDTILIAGHGVLAATVTIYDSDGNSATVSVSQLADANGKTCSVCDITASGLTLDQPEYDVAWPTAGGRPGTDGDEIQFAGKLIAHLLGLTQLRIDWGQVRTAARSLDWLVVAASIEERTEIWPWISDHLLPLLPVSVVGGGKGLRLIPWRWDATDSDVTFQLVAGEGVTRLSPIAFEGIAEINDSTVKFALNSSGNLEEWVRVRGYPEVDDNREHVSKSARLSQDGLRTDVPPDTGERPEVIEADVLFSERAAVQVASWRAEALSRARRTARYWLANYRPIQIGDVGSLFDEEIFVNCLVLVSGRVITERGGLELELILLGQSGNQEAVTEISGSLSITSLPTVYLT